jgi:hypothetical protein
MDLQEEERERKLREQQELEQRRVENLEKLKMENERESEYLQRVREGPVIRAFFFFFFFFLALVNSPIANHACFLFVVNRLYINTETKVWQEGEKRLYQRRRGHGGSRCGWLEDQQLKKERKRKCVVFIQELVIRQEIGG